MVCVGTGTYNNAMAPSVASFLERVKSCKINDKKDWHLVRTDGLETYLQH